MRVVKVMWFEKWITAHPHRAFLAVFIGIFTLFFFLLSHRPLATPDEGRYVEIPREMLETGDYITPHLNNLPYFEKPPLVYWMTAAGISFFGQNTWGARIPLAFFAFLGCLMLYGFSGTYQSSLATLTAPLVLATSTLYFGMARILTLDLFVSVWMAAALLAFYQSVRMPQKKIFSLLYGASLAGAVMTKGLMGIVLPGFIILLWIVWQRRWQLLVKAFHPLTLLSFFLLATPWHLLASLRTPSFAWFYFIHEHFIRYTTVAHGRFQPFWFFIPVLLLGFFPWFCFLFLKHKQQAPQTLPKDLRLFLWMWIVCTFGFFSVSQSKLIPYILPIFPPLAILIAQNVNGLLKRNTPVPLANAALYTTTGLLLGVTAIFARAHNVIQITEGLFCENFLTFLIAAMALVFIATAVGSFFLRKKVKTYFACVLFGHILALCLAAYGDPLVQRYRPIDDVAHFIQTQNENTHPSVVVHGFYPQDLPVYLKNTVHVFAYRGEMSFGAQVQPQQKTLINAQTLQHLWSSNLCFIIILDKNKGHVFPELQKLLSSVYLVYQRSPYVVFSNKPIR